MSHPRSFPRMCGALVALGLIALVVAGSCAFLRLTSQNRAPAERSMALRTISYQQPGPIRGAFNGGVDWINTAGPIRLEDLRGKIVLLDFWTFCCINCHHVLPDLAKLEEKYKDELVVIGVHTAKFDAERDTANIRKKVREYGIKHPVVNDADQAIWQRFGVESWPTLVLIDATGRYFGALPGEGHYAEFDRAIGKLVANHDALGELDRSPVHFRLEDEKVAVDGPLRFPGKVLADPAGDRLFISDTGHNRIVITDLNGQFKDAVGSGTPELKDGDYTRAAFNRPQGMCLVGDDLYVADVENHAIRAIHLKSKAVETVAGTGQQSHQREGSGPAKTTGLNSPWDVLPIPGTSVLAIAMAGPHQIWALDLKAKTVGVMAGSGMENIVDGPYDSAAFAQPSGLATDGKHLFVADSEVSGIRSVELTGSAPQVGRIVGEGLFKFGDVDGTGRAVRLQHCLGVAYGEGTLYIADTYNNKIKACNPAKRSVHTFVGSHKPGSSDDPPHFDEPGGLSVAGSTLYVADTNNHAIRVIDLKTKKVKTLKLTGFAAPTSAPRAPKFRNAIALAAPAAKVAPGKELRLEVALSVPTGYHLNAETAMPYLVESEPSDALSPSLATGARLDKPAERFTVSVPLAKSAAAGETLQLKFSLSTFVCKEGADGFCRLQNYVWTISVTFTAGGADRISISNASAKPAK